MKCIRTKGHWLEVWEIKDGPLSCKEGQVCLRQMYIHRSFDVFGWYCSLQMCGRLNDEGALLGVAGIQCGEYLLYFLTFPGWFEWDIAPQMYPISWASQCSCNGYSVFSHFSSDWPGSGRDIIGISSSPADVANGMTIGLVMGQPTVKFKWPPVGWQWG